MTMIRLLILLIVASPLAGQTLIVEERVKMLALGDSYTIGQSVEPNLRWPVQLINRFRENKNLACNEPRIIATTGWRTDQLKAAIQTAAIQPGDFNLVSLLIGVNNQYQSKSVESYAPEFEELLKTAINIAGSKERVFVLSIPDYGYTPFGQSTQAKISAELDAYNAVNKAISEKLGVMYINITDISRLGLQQPELVASDQLHPSGKMYEYWVNRILSQEAIQYIKSTITNVKKKKGEASLEIFPNPLGKQLNLNGDYTKPVSFTLLNAEGKTALQELVYLPGVIDTEHLRAGAYHYIVNGDNKTLASGHLVKQ